MPNQISGPFSPVLPGLVVAALQAFKERAISSLPAKSLYLECQGSSAFRVCGLSLSHGPSPQSSVSIFLLAGNYSFFYRMDVVISIPF